jgi:plastin-1
MVKINVDNYVVLYLMVVYMQDGEAYAYLLSTLAPEHSSTSDPKERAKKVLETAEKLDCTRYVTSKDIVEGSTNLNLAFVAQIFQNR